MAVNDNIFKELALYDGTTINDRVYAYLGALGYTGTMNDRLAQLVDNEGRRGWQALIALSQYADGTASLVKQLFGNGEQGAFFIPQPQVFGRQVLYQDATGTTPVSADGDPVGLMLDLSRKLELGPERTPDPSFDDPAAWGTNAGSTVTGGTLVFSDGDVVDTIPATESVVGTSYEVSLSIDSVTAGAVRLVVGGVATAYQTTAGTFVQILAASSVGGIRVQSLAGTNAVVTNISVRELPGNHATQATSGSKPLYRTDGVLHWLEFDGVDDKILTPDVPFLSGVNTSHIFVSGRLLQRANNAGFFTVAAGSTTNGTQRSLADSGLATEQMKVDIRSGGHPFAADALANGSYEALFENGDSIGGGVNLAEYTETPRVHNTLNGVMTIGVGLIGSTPLYIYGMVAVDSRLGGASREKVIQHNATLAGVTL